jgi:hypothetical protein
LLLAVGGVDAYSSSVPVSSVVSSCENEQHFHDGAPVQKVNPNGLGLLTVKVKDVLILCIKMLTELRNRGGYHTNPTPVLELLEHTV